MARARAIKRPRKKPEGEPKASKAPRKRRRRRRTVEPSGEGYARLLAAVLTPEGMATRVRFLREKVLELSQEHFARALGRRQSWSAELERSTMWMSPWAIYAVCKATGKSADWLFGLEP